MARPPNLPVLVAADTNVSLDLAIDRDVVLDALQTIKNRLLVARILIPPAVAGELAFIADAGSVGDHREAAKRFLKGHRTWGFQLINYLPVDDDLIDDVGRSLITKGMLPPTEVHDARIVAEAAALDCSILLTGDEHLRGIDFEKLTIELKFFGMRAPVIATPREIV